MTTRRFWVASQNASKAGSSARRLGGTRSSRGRVDLDALGGELAHRLGRYAAPASPAPTPGPRCPSTAASSASKRISGRAEAVGGDAVAGLVVEERVERADLDHDAELAQVVLVALEGLLEGLVTPSLSGYSA